MALTQILLGAVALAAPALAVPAGDRRAVETTKCLAPHDELTVYDASVAEPTRVQGEVVLLENGTPVLTTTETILVVPTAMAASDENTTSCTSVTTTTMTGTSTETVMVSLPMSGAAVATPIVIAGGHQVPATESSTADSSSGNSSSSELFGVSYAPYRADNACKSTEDVENDFAKMKGEYSLVRIYGTDCDQVPNIYAAAKKIDVKLMMGIWDIHNIQNEATLIIDGLNSDWDIVHSVAVGNELVNGGQASTEDVVSAISQARSILRKAGYTGPVVTVDTFIAVESHPQLCEASDFCAINAHAFFDSTMSAQNAGAWLQRTVKEVQSALSKSMQIVITETGWPTKGDANGLAVPGLENQKTALASIKNAFADNPGDIILFSAFDDLWKVSADQHWGINGAISDCDLALI